MKDCTAAIHIHSVPHCCVVQDESTVKKVHATLK